MKLPISWLAEFVEIPAEITIEKICDIFSDRGFEIEGVYNPAEAITGPIVVAEVLAIEELTEHKKPIRYVEIDCGEATSRFVICGATNFQISDKVVVALPGAILPGNFVISARETYGKISNGMICSARELGLSDDQSGIMVVSDSQITVGANALTELKIADPVIDISVNPDRGYAMSIRGAARELASALKSKFSDPVLREINFQDAGSPIPVSIEDQTGADVIHLRTVSGIRANSPTPWFIKRRLQQCDMRPISVAVDITNYVMLEIGQPLHAFDVAKIISNVVVRRADGFKELKTLDGQVRKLATDNLVIADNEKPLAIAGTMGGEESEVNQETKAVAIEAAHFNSTVIAKNSRSHLLSSEASRRFERGVDSAITSYASARAAELLISHAGGQHVGVSSFGNYTVPSAIELTPERISQLIGRNYKNENIYSALTEIGCQVIEVSAKSESGSNWLVTPPTWRPDLITMADLAEEVARIFGYGSIPSILPIVKAGLSSGLTQMQQRKRNISLLLANRGLTEVQTYPFVSSETMALLGFTGDRAKTFKIANPMSEETPFLRTHLTPGLLAAAELNINRGAKSVAIFEIGAVFRNITDVAAATLVGTTKRPTESEKFEIYAAVPKQPIHVAGLLAGEYSGSGWWGKGRDAEWSDAVDFAQEIIRSSGNSFTVRDSDFAPWHPGRCAELLVNGVAVAHAGELHPRVVSAYGLPARSCAFVVVIDALPLPSLVSAPPVWTMPAAIQDISLIVSSEISAAAVAEALRNGAGDLLESVTLFDRYDKLGEGQVSLAFTLVFRAKDRTLTADEVSEFRARAGQEVIKQFNASIRS